MSKMMVIFNRSRREKYNAKDFSKQAKESALTFISSVAYGSCHASRFKSLYILVTILWMTGCQRPIEDRVSLPFYHSAEMTPEWVDGDELKRASMHQVAPFTFQNQDGETITEADLEGKIYVANFFFVQCTSICPTMRSNLAKVQEAYLDDSEVLLLSHTVTPEVDTIPILHKYGQLNEVVGGKWHLLTGEQEAIYRLARESYFADLEADLEDNFLHTENFVLIDQHRRIRGIYNGTLQLEVQRLIEDIATLKQEKVS